ncbi:MAG: DUF1080 domain-containing protein [Candidatus Omnitrophica bacterium]|nr:hypothetical protein [bacterium]NUN96491.1 DUF1080 domain-containing protein [Candidatus Omnitrophota bacterium]
MRLIHPVLIPGLLLLAAITFSGCSKVEGKKNNEALTLQNGVLMRGDKPAEARCIEAPGIAKVGTPYETYAMALHRAADVGANCVCTELDGFSLDGSSLDEGAVKAARALLRDATQRHMALVFRVFSASASTEAAFRTNAVKTAAKAFAERPEAIYVIEGSGAKQLTAQFKELAPKVLVASPAGGDLALIDSSTPHDASAKPPFLHFGSLPMDRVAQPHFVLPDADRSYADLDAALADPIESQPWTPDNSVLSEEERNEGWIALFDGKTFNGWTITGANQNGWKINDGVIEWAEDGGGVVRSRDRYDNFILRLDWKIDAGGNSGVFVRAPRASRASRIGMEVQIEGDYGEPPDTTSTGSLYSQQPPLLAAQKPNGEWNSYEITLDGPRIKVVLNGQVVQDLDTTTHPDLKLRLRRGFIGLQDHHNHAAFRNIRIKPL